MKGDIHQHILPLKRVAQIAQAHITAKSSRPRRISINKNLPRSNCVQPGLVFLIIGGVDYDQVLVFRAAINEGVIDYIRVWIKEMRVNGLSDFQGADVIATNAVEEHARIRPFRLEHAHMADIK